MGNHHRIYEIRCPVYGFVTHNDWEREIINQPEFQRLRRIRQLAWTDYVYPGAMHTRFEHSLGVMHMATMLYDGIVERSRHLLIDELGYNDDGLRRHRALVRIAALLHDVGHAPFSHATEELFPLRKDENRRFRHEHYSAEIVRQKFSNLIKDHPLNKNYGFTAEEVANFLESSATAGGALIWRDLIDGQMDADRMDYLLRDSLHAGVDYGRYDWQRLVRTVQLVPGDGKRSPRLGVSEGGSHAAEGLILARYFMFTQVYFHKTRVAYDHHLKHALSEMLPDRLFPKPTGTDLDEYLKWDDWRVLGLLAEGKGGDHGRRITNRNHFREVIHTPETPTQLDLEKLDRWKDALGSKLAAEERAEKSWYNPKEADIPIASVSKLIGVRPLSQFSSFVSKMESIRKVSLYVKPEDVENAQQSLHKIKGESK